MLVVIALAIFASPIGHGVTPEVIQPVVSRYIIILYRIRASLQLLGSTTYRTKPGKCLPLPNFAGHLVVMIEVPNYLRAEADLRRHVKECGDI